MKRMSAAICLLTMSLSVLTGCTQNNTNRTSAFLGESKNLYKLESNKKLFSEQLPSDAHSTYLQLSTMLATSMLQCPDRIWPDYNWQKMNVIMLQKGAPSLVWKGSTGQIENLPEDQVPEGARQGMYSFFQWNGEDAVSIYSGISDTDIFFKSANNVLELIVHEGFHYLGQRNWTYSSATRGTVYPVNATPREYRRMIFDNLKTYFISKGSDQTSLGKAAYWFEKWQNEFPEEASATTDGYEGTARYVEYLAPAIVASGCTASEDELLAKISQLILNPDNIEYLGYSISGQHFELDSEGYDIGSLAAFILRFTQKNMTWQQEVKKGETPLKILMKNVTPIADVIPTDIQTKFLETQNSANNEIGPVIEGEINHNKDFQFERVVFSTAATKGSYSTKGFYLPTELPSTTLILLAHAYEFKSNAWTMTAEANKVLITSNVTTPCNNGHFFTVINKSDISIQDGKIKINQPDIHGEMIGTEKTDAQGFSWFCGE